MCLSQWALETFCQKGFLQVLNPDITLGLVFYCTLCLAGPLSAAQIPLSCSNTLILPQAL